MEDMNLPTDVTAEGTVGAAENTDGDVGTRGEASDDLPGEGSVEGTEREAASEAVPEPCPVDTVIKNAELPSPKTARLTYSSYAEMRPSPSSKYAPMGLGGYITMLVIALIPVVGFIVSAIVACSSKKLARQRLALAIVLITTVITVILGALAFVVIYVFDVDVVGEVVSFFGR